MQCDAQADGRQTGAVTNGRAALKGKSLFLQVAAGFCVAAEKVDHIATQIRATIRQRH